MKCLSGRPFYKHVCVPDHHPRSRSLTYHRRPKLFITCYQTFRFGGPTGLQVTTKVYNNNNNTTDALFKQA
jgi:hypothetical protein